MDKSKFLHPLDDSKKTVGSFWFWNDKITDEKTEEQLKMMNRAGVRQATLHARSGLLTPYLSEEWFERVKHAVKITKELGMQLWLYDEDGWPSGNASWTLTKDEAAREHYLEIKSICLSKGEEYVFDRKEKYISITAVYSDGSAEQMPNDSKVCSAKSDTVLYITAVKSDEYEELGKFSIDYMSKEQIRKFIDCTHEKYAERFGDEFGKTIRGTFMDETRFCNALPWTEGFADEFKRRKGYDLIPMLYMLTADTEQSGLVRYDYYDVCADLMLEATFLQIYNWADEHGLETTGHFLGEETLASQSRYNIDMMRMYKGFHVPGIDHLANGIGSLDAKMCSSAAYNYGRTTVNSESFGACGWDMKLEEVVKISNWLYQQGINQHMMHGFYYSIRDERKNDWPPSYFYQWQDWDKLPEYTEMAARMSYMLSDGIAEADVLVYYPIETFWQHFEPNFDLKIAYFKDGYTIENEKAAMLDRDFQLLCNTLSDKNIDYHILNDDAADNFTVKDGKAVNKLTGAEYSVIILPNVELLPEKTARLINTLTENGGKIISYKSNISRIVFKNGSHLTGRGIAEIKVPDISEMYSAESLSSLLEICGENINRHFTVTDGVSETAHTLMHYSNRIQDPYLHDGEQVFGVGITRYLKDGFRIFNVTNYNACDEQLIINVEAGEQPEIFDPQNGDIKPADAYENGSEWTVKLKLPKNRALFIVTRK